MAVRECRDGGMTPLDSLLASGMLLAMTAPESKRLALYNGLTEILGPELTDRLMAYLPPSEASGLATKADVDRLGATTRSEFARFEEFTRSELARVDDSVALLRDDVRRLQDSTRSDLRDLSATVSRLQMTLLGGFAAVIPALVGVIAFG